MAVKRHPAPSGNRDSDYFQAVCGGCGWSGGMHSNRTIEGRGLADRDDAGHVCLEPEDRGSYLRPEELAV